MSGIAIDSALARSPAAYAAVLFVPTVALLFWSARRRARLTWLIVPAAAVGALLHHAAYRRAPADHIVHWTSPERPLVARLRGNIVSEPRLATGARGPFAAWMYQPNRTSFLVEATAIESDGRFLPVVGRVRVTVKEAVMDLDPAQTVELFGYLHRPPPPDNPGSFDWATWNRRHGLLVGMSCNHRECVRTVALERSGPWRGWIATARRRVRGLLLDDLLATPNREANLLDAMILARRSSLDPSVQQAFVETGAAHYLAASGFHVGMLGLFIYGLGRIAGATRRHGAVVVMVATVLYAVLAEPRPPIFRATVLAVAICAALLTGRRRAYFNWLALSAVAYLIWRPMELFDVGFQMSYVAVTGILLLAPAIHEAALRILYRSSSSPSAALEAELLARDDRRTRRRHRLSRWFLYPGSVAIAAWLSTLPLAVFHFQQCSLWGWLNTLLLFPLIVAVMFTGFATLLISLISPMAAGWLTPVIDSTAGSLLWWVGQLSRIPGTSVTTTVPPAAWVAVCYGLLLAGAACHRGLIRPSFLIAVAGVWVCATTVWLAPRPPDNNLTVTVLSVGRGTSIVLELPTGQTVLYDAGCSGSYDPGRTAILPYLISRGIRRVDAAIVSHPNLDHFGGLLTVMDRLQVGRVILSPHFEPLSTPTNPSFVFLQEVRRRGVPIDLLDTTAGRFGLGGAYFEVLWPPPTAPFELTANESSIVLRVTCRSQAILLTGDIEEHAQDWLLKSGVDLSADVLLMPHHGSLRDNTAALVEAVDPTWVVCSTSRRREQLAARLTGVVGSRVLLDTADDGAIQVVLGGRRVEVVATRNVDPPSIAH